MSLRGKKYSGDLYGRKFGSTDPAVKLGNLTSLTFEKSSDTEELQSTGKNDYGQAIESVTKPGVTKIKMEFNTFDKSAMARALMGEAVDLTTTPKTVTDEALVATVGQWLKLAEQDIDPAGITLKAGAGGTAVPAEHFEVNARLGMVRLIAGKTTVQDKDPLKISYKTKGSKGFAIDADTVQRFDMELYLDGRDRITGEEGILNIWHAALQSDGNLDWLSDDWWKNGVSGTALKPADKPTPYRFTQFTE